MSPELKLIKQIVYGERPPYPGLVVDVREEWVDGKPRAAFIILYRDNFEGFSEDQKVGIGMWISDVIKTCRQAVGQSVFLEVEPYVSGRIRG